MTANRPAQFSDFGFNCWRGSPTPMSDPHRHDEIEVNLIEQGEMTYLFNGTQIVVTAGRLFLFWGAVPHQAIAVGDAVLIHWLTLPLGRFLAWRLSEELVQAVLHGYPIFELDLAEGERDIQLMARWEQDFESGSIERQQIVLLELEARLRRLSLTTVFSPHVHSVSSRSSGKPQQMAQFIAAHYTEAIRLEDVAAAVGLHPNYAMKLFRQAFDRSLLDYLTQHRLTHAQRLLVTTDASILDIALDSGFGSLSRFYAVFKQACAQSPGEYRAALRHFVP